MKSFWSTSSSYYCNVKQCPKHLDQLIAKLNITNCTFAIKILSERENYLITNKVASINSPWIVEMINFRALEAKIISSNYGCTS